MPDPVMTCAVKCTAAQAVSLMGVVNSKFQCIQRGNLLTQFNSEQRGMEHESVSLHQAYVADRTFGTRGNSNVIQDTGLCAGQL